MIENMRVGSTVLAFSFIEMVDALKRIGYEIREESVEVGVDRFQYQEILKYKVYNVYLTHSSTPCAEHAGYGGNRVKWVFEEELKSRMLRLFK